MHGAKAFRNQHLDRLRDEFRPPVAENGLGLRIRQRDHAFAIDQENRARNRLDDRTEALLACPQLRRQLRRCNEVPDELVAHRQHDDEEAGHEDGGRVYDAGDDHRGEAGGRHDAKGKAAADEGGAAARHGSAPAPQGDGGIDDEHDEQQVAELGDDRPWIRDADGTDDDGASKKLQMVQRRDFPEVHVHARQEIQREGGQPNPDHRVGEPEPTCVEVKAHEPHDRDDRTSASGT